MYPGPRNWFLPVFPRPGFVQGDCPVHPDGCENAVVSNHGFADPTPPNLWKLPVSVAVWVVPGVLRVPPLAVMVKGSPETAEIIPAIFHPPSTASPTAESNSWCPRPPASS